MTARALWQCPECSTRLTSCAQSEDVARDGLVQMIREHLDHIHPDVAGLTNAAAQASGWLSAAGHLVTLWGGPEDGAEVWLPPGELPRVIGVHRGEDGRLYPLRSAMARLLLQERAQTYVLGIDGTGTTAADRYVWTP